MLPQSNTFSLYTFYSPKIGDYTLRWVGPMNSMCIAWGIRETAAVPISICFGYRSLVSCDHFSGIAVRKWRHIVIVEVFGRNNVVMQTLSRPQQNGSNLPKPRRGRRFSPLMLIGILVTLVVVVGGGAFVISQQKTGSHAAANAAVLNMDCSLIVPANPLTAQGLAAPYQLVATNANNGPCNEGNKAQAAFVQGAVIDPATGQISVYDPLVIDQGTQPAAAPVVPTLPQGAIVALWFGFNGNNLTLNDMNGSLQAGQCVNGVNGSIFGQFSYCNAPAFFQAANKAIQGGQLVIPALGTAKDGMPCPTVRDFGVVDMDQSDNVTTTYIVNANGQTAQMNAANTAALQNTQIQVNASDNRLVDVALDGTLGCTPWAVNDLANPGQTATSLPLNELLAAAQQAAPIALVPSRDPMVLNNANTSIQKINAYRAGVDQAQVQAINQASTMQYCRNLMKVGPQRIQLDAPMTILHASPDPAAANSLFTFLTQRFAATFGPNGLNCAARLKVASPISVTVDGNNVAITATINGNLVGPNGIVAGAAGGGAVGGGAVGGTATTPNCTVNGTAVAGCAGTTTINGQTCTIAFANNTVNITCPNAQQAGGNGGKGGKGGKKPKGANSDAGNHTGGNAPNANNVTN